MGKNRKFEKIFCILHLYMVRIPPYFGNQRILTLNFKDTVPIMRYISIFLIISLFYACNFNPPQRKADSSKMKFDVTIDTAKIAQIRLTNPADYRRILDTIDPGDLSSLDAACTLFRNCVADTLTRDSMFVILNDFFNHLAGIYLENNEKVSNQLLISPSVQTINTIHSSLETHGLLLCSSEGAFFIEPYTPFLLQNFGRELSSAYRDYLTIESEEQKERFVREGKTVIPPDSLVARIVTWDHFITKYPRFISIRNAQDKDAQYLGAYLAGTEGSTVFDPETTVLNDSSRLSFESFIVKNPEIKSTQVVRDYLELLRTSDFRYTEKVDSFLLKKVFGADIVEEQK